MKNNVYDVLKWIAIIVLPALSTFVAVTFKIWQIPYGNEIAQTITALATCLGSILMVSNAKYNSKLDTGDKNFDVPED